MDDERFPLGKPIRAPKPEQSSECVEVSPGVFRIEGKLQTWIPENERANNPSIDFILEAMERLKDPEFPVFWWGSW